MLLRCIMGPFRIQNAYPEEVNDDSDSESELEIDLDVSDTELLELQQNLKKLDSKKMQCDLADATIALQASIMKQWKQYCFLSLPSLSTPQLSASQKCQSVAADWFSGSWP